MRYGVEALDGFLDGHHDTWQTCKLFCNGKRLREEALHTTCAVHGQLVLVGELVHAKDGDDVLKLLVTLQNLLDTLCTLVMLLSYDQRIEDARC